MFYREKLDIRIQVLLMRRDINKDFNLLNPNDANKIKRDTPERVIKDCKEVEMINNCLTGNGPCDLE